MHSHAVNENAHYQQASSCFLVGHYASYNEQKISPNSYITNQMDF